MTKTFEKQLHNGPLTTAALCLRAQVTRGTLRVYEREGLIDASVRTKSGYRNYPVDTVARLLAIKHLKEVGFTLKEIAVLLSKRDAHPFDTPLLIELAKQQLNLIDERITRLQVVRGYVAQVANGDAAVFDDPECTFLIQFLTQEHLSQPTDTKDESNQ